MVKSPRLVYRPNLDVTPESEAHVLAEVYSFVLRAREEKEKGASPGTPDNDVRKDSEDGSRR